MNQSTKQPQQAPKTHLKKRLCILGATGSIGQSTLDIIRLHTDKYRLFAVSGYQNWTKLLQICQAFNPKFAVVGDEYFAQFHHTLDELGLPTKALKASEGLDFIAKHEQVDIAVCAIVGAAGLSSTLSAVKAGKTVLLANKEALVMAGDLVMNTAKQTGAVVLPIDSEHNAIFQCLPYEVQNNPSKITQHKFGIKRLWLTASGGAFLHKSFDEMQNASIDEAITHPNWSMGQKISIDSATMMNKGLEVIEACHLFGVDVDNVAVVIHPQSIVHSMVQYTDGSFIAQLATPDMKIPIAHALAYPNRMDSGAGVLDLYEMANLQFLRPDMQKFACLSLAIQAIKIGNGACIVLNAANEVAVQAFLAGKIALTDIAKIIAWALDDDGVQADLPKSFDDLTAIMALDNKARTLSWQLIENFKA